MRRSLERRLSQWLDRRTGNRRESLRLEYKHRPLRYELDRVAWSEPTRLALRRSHLEHALALAFDQPSARQLPNRCVLRPAARISGEANVATLVRADQDHRPVERDLLI